MQVKKNTPVSNMTDNRYSILAEQVDVDEVQENENGYLTRDRRKISKDNAAEAQKQARKKKHPFGNSDNEEGISLKT